MAEAMPYYYPRASQNGKQTPSCRRAQRMFLIDTRSAWLEELAVRVPLTFLRGRGTVLARGPDRPRTESRLGR